jgi:type 2 lantibiotic biosynthesis protein LanM
MDSLTEDDLLTLLDEPGEAVQAHNSPSPTWLIELLTAFADADTTADFTLPLPTMGEEDTHAMAFLNPLKPLLRSGLARLQAGIQELTHKYASLPFDPQTIVPLLFTYIPELILPKLSKTIVLELNVARVQGHLQGETAEERFQYFLQQLGQHENMLSLLKEYAVLARQLVETLNRWVSCELELVERLCADWQQIQSLFPPASDPGVLTEIEQGVGDTYRGGQSVAILTWSSGFRLVYKPRAMTLDLHFQGLLVWLNTLGQQPAFRPLTIIDKQTYGWSEFVPAYDCTSREEVERFYQRQGGYLALLYALEATDFHAGNLIAAGEHPILVDLEALFHERLDEYETMLQANPGDEILEHSVLRIGLLPERYGGTDETEGIDLSGLGGHAGQLLPTPVRVWKELGTDQMRVIRERVRLSSGKHQPKLNGHDINVLEYRESIVTGFAATYRLLIHHRRALLTEIVPRFAHDEVRFLLRSTSVYARLLQESFHPNVLRDALDRDRLFDRLWIGVERHPYLSSKVIAAERADLLAGDIPLFTTRPDSRDLLTSRGETIADFFEESALNMVSKHIQQLEEQDLEQQIWIIRASLTAITMGIEPAIQPRLYLQPSASSVTYERLIMAARAVGDRLCKLALHREESVGWVGVTLEREQEWSLLPTSTDLYSGTPGIVLFLAYLGMLTGEERYTTLARLALASTRSQVARQDSIFLQQSSNVASIGAFAGLGGFIYLLSHLGALWNDPTLYQEAEEMIRLLPDAISRDEMMDVTNGSAGCIAALLSLYAVAPSQSTLATAIQCGDHLIASARSQKTGIGWSTTTSRETALTGFSHGNAGIALNLLRLFAVSGEERFRQTALAAMEYERSLFSLERRNWPDMRQRVSSSATRDQQTKQEDSNSYMVAWCHGASGIGLARLESLKYIDDAALRAEIEAALQTTLAEGFGMNHCLCHGDMGNLEFVLTATKLLSLPQYEEQVQHLTSMLLDSIERHGWVSGVPLGVETPGLMIGIAGIGYALLWLACAKRIPSVLLLAPPCTATL